MYSSYQAKYFKEQLTLKRPSNSIENLVSALAGARVDLNPHQVDAAMFAFKSPLSQGVLLADEVGLGKTIEAGIVLAQYFAERKRKILLIVPAALRNQWLSELDEKFYIKSIILESKNFNRLKKQGMMNPFEQKDSVVICSYNFVASKQFEVSKVNWDLVVIDEAHRLRNVYKTNNVTGRKLKDVLNNRRKLLLTATPLQNNLMELYGLVSIIDDRVFGDAKTFRDKYINVDNEMTRNIFLKARLQQFCKRTLRKQVVEYVPYTKRTAILEEYTPSIEEETLYNEVSEYLRSPVLYALPNSQRTLMTLVLRKLLASSSFAISGTLDSLILRLQNMLAGIDSEINLDDYDTLDELLEELDLAGEEDKVDAIKQHYAISEELEKLKSYAKLAKSIKRNSKGENLLTALEKGFSKATELGASKKAVIFTESRRTQDYLYNLLSANGYEGKIVFLNGTNSDENSKRIYKEWIERHKGEDIVSGSKQADTKAAIVEEFRSKAEILIGTEAAAEGINLQFCSLLVNYDLPWNPQRIEQRIGRCHRYGQKNDVVVINFLNNKNDADKRVYELLDQKFKLFEGLFGSSDEVLGSIESGVDFEKRISDIYQNCNTADEIRTAFDKLQEEYREQINEKIINARQTLLENFDEEVSSLLKIRNSETNSSISKYEKWIYYFMLSQGNNNIKVIDDTRFQYIGKEYSGAYNLNWKDSDNRKEIFLRREHPLCQKFIEQCDQNELNLAEITFNYSQSGRKISFIDTLIVKKGWISVSKLVNNSFEEQEYLLVSAICDNGVEIEADLVDRLMALEVLSVKNVESNIIERIVNHQKQLELQTIKDIEMKNKEFFLQECAKLDEWSEDLKNNLQVEIKDIEKLIKEKKKEFDNSIDLDLTQMLDRKEELNKLKRLRDKKRRELYDEEDKVDEENDRLQAQMRSRVKGSTQVKQLFTIRFDIR
ncbi:SNF2-related protein [Clostridium algidicarnis]|uniref:Helicase-like protein n=1 Tax=Clostridium algidicarnis DSM 15099 TaxID=1121295 RepID=A0A2S6G085_9CLOT|nr:SNF2-related protein [Clostridium algidicarnis]PPK49298.1 helicase-like protein [Clostridium algidicarnis DSM 15099]